MRRNFFRLATRPGASSLEQASIRHCMPAFSVLLRRSIRPVGVMRENGRASSILFPPSVRSPCTTTPLRVEGERLGESLLQLASASGKASHQGKHWRIPVCFDADLAPDLDDLAQAKGITREAVIRLLSEARFQVYMIGFMPGFPYMCGLPKALEMPRLASPRQVVPARSLAIANEMCAVYPWESPGGWRLLGRTPIPMFSASVRDAPSLLASGDQVEWQPIERDRFDELENSVMEGRFMRDSLLLPPGEH